MEIRVLHADDDQIELDKVSEELQGSGGDDILRLESLSSAGSFLERLKSGETPDAVVLDIHFDDEEISGIELAEKTREVFPNTAIVMMTDRERMIRKSIQAGANEFISKSCAPGELRKRILAAVQRVNEKTGLVGATSKDIGNKKEYPTIIGKSMGVVANKVEKIVDSAVEAVLVSGETGTGKEVVADLFEYHAGEPFVRVNCGALKPELIEAELFGAVKGAYTGANQNRMGLLESAHRGWVFLDEIHCLPKSGQSSLLRVIENNQLRRVGESSYRDIDVRIIAASNENLEAMSESGEFRHDLLNRLMETKIELLPVRERTGEIKELIQYFCKTAKGGPYEMDEVVLKTLCQYDWRHGNVREIRNCIRAMTANHVNKTFTAMSVPTRIWHAIEKSEALGRNSESNPNEIRICWLGGIPDYVEVEKRALSQYLKKYFYLNGKTTLRSLSPQMGINRKTMSNRIKQLVNEGYLEAEMIRRYLGLDV